MKNRYCVIDTVVWDNKEGVHLASCPTADIAQKIVDMMNCKCRANLCENKHTAFCLVCLESMT
jgi:hypothetical protein